MYLVDTRAEVCILERGIAEGGAFTIIIGLGLARDVCHGESEAKEAEKAKS